MWNFDTVFYNIFTTFIACIKFPSHHHEYYPEFKQIFLAVSATFGNFCQSIEKAEIAEDPEIVIYGNFGRSAGTGAFGIFDTFGNLSKLPKYHLSAFSGISAVLAESAENNGICRKCRIYRKFSDFGYVWSPLWRWLELLSSWCATCFLCHIKKKQGHSKLFETAIKFSLTLVEPRTVHMYIANFFRVGYACSHNSKFADIDSLDGFTFRNQLITIM